MIYPNAQRLSATDAADFYWRHIAPAMEIMRFYKPGNDDNAERSVLDQPLNAAVLGLLGDNIRVLVMRSF